MRVLRVHTEHADPAVTGAVDHAIQRFNRGLDVRLRFLSIGIEDAVVRPGEGVEVAAEIDAALDRHQPEIVLIVGSGAAAPAAATVAARRRVRTVRLGAGNRSGPHADYERATDRVCTWRLCLDRAALSRLEEEGLGADSSVVGDSDSSTMADRVVDALSRIRRTKLGEE